MVCNSLPPPLYAPPPLPPAPFLSPSLSPCLCSRFFCQALLPRATPVQLGRSGRFTLDRQREIYPIECTKIQRSAAQATLLQGTHKWSWGPVLDAGPHCARTSNTTAVCGTTMKICTTPKPLPPNIITPSDIMELHRSEGLRSRYF